MKESAVKFAHVKIPEYEDYEGLHIPEGNEKMKSIVGVLDKDLPILVGVTPEGDKLDLTKEVD